MFNLGRVKFLAFFLFLRFFLLHLINYINNLFEKVFFRIDEENECSEDNVNFDSVIY